jgi:hypothetical protein
MTNSNLRCRLARLERLTGIDSGVCLECGIPPGGVDLIIVAILPPGSPLTPDPDTLPKCKGCGRHVPAVTVEGPMRDEMWEHYQRAGYTRENYRDRRGAPGHSPEQE